MKKVFIVGPIKGSPGNIHDEFLQAAEYLKSKGYKSTHPFTVFDDMNECGFKDEQYLNHCVSELAHCDAIVTLLEWDRDPNAEALVKIARILKKVIMPITQLTKE